MAAVGSTLPAAAATTAAGATSSSGSSVSAASLASSDALGNEQTFLQLLVAQLQNQDPTNPMDGTQFVSQLAQFAQLEQDIAMRGDLDKLAGALEATPAGAGTGSTGTSSTGNSSTNANSTSSSTSNNNVTK
jgi:flagellar basal-body rod modification protein FlgD